MDRCPKIGSTVSSCPRPVHTGAQAGPRLLVVPRIARSGSPNAPSGTIAVVLSRTRARLAFQAPSYKRPARIEYGAFDPRASMYNRSDNAFAQWLAAKACTDDTCQKTKLYDPSSATPTGQNFGIQYLQGNASGPIYWDQLDMGGYSISHQALGASLLVHLTSNIFHIYNSSRRRIAPVRTARQRLQRRPRPCPASEFNHRTRDSRTRWQYA